MHIYTNENGSIQDINIYPHTALPENTIWIDLLNVTPAEEKHLENLLQIDIPTPDETSNICVSNRLYKKDNAIYMTITFYLSPTNDLTNLEPHTITFIIIKNTLITIRDIDCNLFTNFLSNLQIANIISENIELTLLTTFLENIINDTAALLEQVTHKLNTQNESILDPTIDSHKTSYKVILKEIANIGEVVSKIQESLISLSRMLNFLSQVNTLSQKTDFNSNVKTFLKDISALTDHASFISNKLNFILDATLGLINIEQNAIIKIFSIASVIFLPPTLIASIFGMNFKVMPELSLSFGYPLSLLLMGASAILSLLYFKKKHWL
jgi:magnesium transporter